MKGVIAFDRKDLTVLSSNILGGENEQKKNIGFGASSVIAERTSSYWLCP